jgi:hypothetical protein
LFGLFFDQRELALKAINAYLPLMTPLSGSQISLFGLQIRLPDLMKFYWLILGVLSVWRVTHFLQAEDGPWDIVVRLRLGVGNGFWGKLLDCFYCLSVWISAPFAWWLGEDSRERVLLWISFSAGAILLQKLTSPRVPPAPYVEEPVGKEEYGVLRTEEKPGSAADGPRPAGQ